MVHAQAGQGSEENGGQGRAQCQMQNAVGRKILGGKAKYEYRYDDQAPADAQQTREETDHGAEQ